MATGREHQTTCADALRRIQCSMVPLAVTFAVLAPWSSAAEEEASVPAIVSVQVEGRGDRVCRLGDAIRVRLKKGDIDKLRDSLEKAAKPVELLLEGRFLKGTPYERVAAGDELRFELVRTDENKQLWSELLGGRWPWGGRRIRVGVGVEGGLVAGPADPNASDTILTFRVPSSVSLLLAATLTLTLLVATPMLAWKTNMLRDRGQAAQQGTMPSFSLARTQMAFWFVNIVVAFLYIWAATGALDTVTPTALALMGIAAGTALGAAVVDDAKRLPVSTSQSMLKDLLTDATGYSLHRLQLLTWTLVLWIVFWRSVWRALAMPDFDATLLALMGISNGTYVGFKIPERQ